MMSEVDSPNLNADNVSTSLTVARLLSHLREPKNLLTWLVLSAWLKYMGLQQYVPSITVGG